MGRLEHFYTALFLLYISQTIFAIATFSSDHFLFFLFFSVSLFASFLFIVFNNTTLFMYTLTIFIFFIVQCM